MQLANLFSPYFDAVEMAGFFNGEWLWKRRLFVNHCRMIGLSAADCASLLLTEFDDEE